MRKLVKLSLILLAITMIFPSCVSKKKFTELLSSKETIDATLAQTESKLKKIEGEKNDLMSQKSDLESKNADLNSALTSAKSQIAGLEGKAKELEEAKETIVATETKLTKVEQTIKGIFSSYEGSGLQVTQKNNRLYVVMETPVTFRSGSTRLGKDQRNAVTALAEVLKANPGMDVQVEGHSDNAKFVDGKGNNWNLSMKRAMNTLNYLLGKGVSPNQLSAVGRGEFAPVVDADPDSKEARAQNRRVEFVITPNLASVAAPGVTP